MANRQSDERREMLREQMLGNVTDYNHGIKFRAQFMIMPANLWSQIVEALNDPEQIDDELKQMILESGEISHINMSPDEISQLHLLKNGTKETN